MTRGLYQLRPELPFTLGREAAGVFAETAPDVTGWRPGDRAIVRLRPGALAEVIVLPLERAAEALELLVQRRVVGKAVLTMP